MRGLIIGLVVGLLLAGIATSDAATQKKFVTACVQMSGPKASVGDINVRLKKACLPHQKPIKIATYPTPPGPPGPRGPEGPSGPQGPKGDPGTTTTHVFSSTTNTTVNSPKSLTVSCQNGTHLTGGGFMTSVLSDELILRRSSPLGSNSWTADVAEQDAFQNNIAWSLTVYVVCIG